MKALLGVTLLSMLVAGCGAPDMELTAHDIGSKLSDGMTEDQVTKALGFLPSEVTLTTCGQQSPIGPWPCKKWRYFEDRGDTVFGTSSIYKYWNIYFEETPGNVWVVNSWDATPDQFK